VTAQTPDWKLEAELKPRSSRYVKMQALPWWPTPFAAVEIKGLLEDEDSGLMTTLTRMAPVAVLPLHKHVGIEPTCVLDGRLVDDEGEAKAGE
jgi:anti-sigma factor ChrR (cupin superfamily)